MQDLLVLQAGLRTRARVQAQARTLRCTLFSASCLRAQVFLAASALVWNEQAEALVAADGA